MGISPPQSSEQRLPFRHGDICHDNTLALPTLRHSQENNLALLVIQQRRSCTNEQTLATLIWPTCVITSFRVATKSMTYGLPDLEP
ncbi:hypothetical protein E2C01_051898 [Portunus trituberculatus]|uniref:Uncharacterized protein n=1 Tax=Portunus trituberculatus TaxID=210409 RepID=A0A5B7GK33_PORTR|nr:hypothetical protein [Portunus trituberculatus]